MMWMLYGMLSVLYMVFLEKKGYLQLQGWEFSSWGLHWVGWASRALLETDTD
mgnify:CR=1 FL=1